jgi:hypothetical protein
VDPNESIGFRVWSENRSQTMPLKHRHALLSLESIACLQYAAADIGRVRPGGVAIMPVLYPVFALFVLTAYATLRLAYLRLIAVKTGQVNPKFYRDYQGYEEPEKLRIASRHVINLYEAPVLFYTVSIIAYVTEVGGFAIVAMAWAYVLLRYLHSYVHLTSNKVLLRFRLFATSQAILVAIWITVFIGMLQKHAY